MRKEHQKVLVKRLIRTSFGDAATRDLDFMTQNEPSYQFFNGFVVLRHRVYACILTVTLLVFMFMERFCFLTIVYKTKCTNYVLILGVALVNCLLLLIQNIRRRAKVQKKMHSLFNLEMAQKPPLVAVIFVGLLDMAYAFCLFWPANVIPIFVLTCSMQLFIPLNTLLGNLLCGRP